MAFGGHTSYSSFAQPFQPLGQPLTMPISHAPALTSSNTWNAASPMQIPYGHPVQHVQFVCGSPQDNDHIPYSYPTSFNTGHTNEKCYLNRKPSNCDMSNQSPALKHSRSLQFQPTPFPPYPHISGLYSSSPTSATAFSAPETSYYPPAGFSQPRRYSEGPTLGLSADDISVHASHCRSLVDAVKESQQCSYIFSKWRDSLDVIGKKDKFEAGIICSVNELAEEATRMLNASRNILASYKALAHVMDRRLYNLAMSPSGGGELFGSRQANLHGQDEIKALKQDVATQTNELSMSVNRMQKVLRGLQFDLMRMHEKYAFWRRFWDITRNVFQLIAKGLSITGAVSAVVHPLGTAAGILMQCGSWVLSLIAAVCEKITEAYTNDGKTLNEVLKLLHDEIPCQIRVVDTALRKFKVVDYIFDKHRNVKRGHASGYITSDQADLARTSWSKARGLLELNTDEAMLQINPAPMSL